MKLEIVPHSRVPRRRALRALVACAALLGMTAAAAADDARCQQVRFSDVGWTDITATTAVVTEILKDRGYRTKIDLLSVPVTFRSLKNHDIDVFLGNWMPTMTADIQPYLDDGSVVDVAVNLEGALYTLAVPRYVYQAGVRSAADLAANGAKFQHRIPPHSPFTPLRGDGGQGKKVRLETTAPKREWAIADLNQEYTCKRATSRR